ncbi:hypothetical protein PMAYCL1PPCAC_26826 [Pristionchus mayeri]|uniref:NTR domain-containing protein n=1 Tax=Pristionchus mayeri TaxID=1317129 RepID=A0AAN5D4D0_9BILA|nr:hypothetical protein PMAYCL1PPCAC_26826 [Pristionchus mayeri]
MICRLAIILLIFDLSLRVKACSCMPVNATYVFEHSDFVSRVLVERAERTSGNFPASLMSDEFRPPEMIYTVRHLDVYKSPNSTLDIPTQVRTPGDSAACGVNLSEGQTIVLAGSWTPSHLSIFLCSHGSISQEEAERLRI